MIYDRALSLSALDKLLAPDRIRHSLNVEKYAGKLARIHCEDEGLCSAAGLLHDMARDQSDQKLLELATKFGYGMDDILKKHPKLLHGPASAELAKQLFGIRDRQVLDAIANHTIPAQQMSRADKIIFIADKLEEGRSYAGVDELRRLSETDLDECFHEIIKQTISYLLCKGQIIHPGTIRAYNEYIEANKTFAVDK